MLNILQKLLPCFSSPQQADEIIVRDGFTTVPTPIKTLSAPPNGHPNGNSAATTTKKISPALPKKHIEVPEHINAVLPNVVEDGDENWEDWRNPEVKASGLTIEEIATVLPTTIQNGVIPDLNEIAPIIAPLSVSKKTSEPPKKEEDEKPAEPEVDWFSDMTPTYKPPPRLITKPTPTTAPTSALTVTRNATPPPSTVNRLSLASLEMEQDEVDDEGWIEDEPAEETVAPSRVSKLDAKKKEKKSKKSQKGGQ